MSILEEKIRKNRGRYDVHEPVDGHFERFSVKLDEAFHPKGKRRLPWKSMLRYAAAILIIGSITTILLIQFSGKSTRLQASPVNEELAQAMDHYNRLADQKLEQISTCALSDEEAGKLDQMARADIEKLENDARNLQHALDQDASNKKVLDALVNNYRTRVKILDNILTRICEL